MAPNVILSGNFNDFKSVFWSGKEIYTYSSQLKSFLTQQMGDKYANIFAEPFVTEDYSKIRWLSEVISPNAKKLSKLPINEQVVAKHKLKTIIEEIEKFADSLITSGQADAVKWGEIIKNATDVPSFEYIFVEGENIVLTAWGFETAESISNNFKLTKEILKEKTPLIPTPPVEKVEEKKIEEPKKETPVIPTPPPKKEEPIPQPEIKEEKKEKKSGTPFYKKWWFWLIIALLILALLYFLLFFNKNSKHLPDHEAIIPPIDTTKIVDDPNGRQIISNQLILYVGNKDKTVNELADDFKKLYPGDDYKIIYYNTNGAKRINIEFPADEKQDIIDKIKNELTDYQLVIVDETIFNNEMVPPDPGFLDEHKSWSYEAIKAYTAWDMTQGNPNIIVAIIDDGFDLSQPEFQGKITNPYNVPAGTNQPNTGRVGMYHGTHVAATSIGNIGNAMGMCGVAPYCTFMPIQVGDANGNMSTTAIIDAIFYAIDNGADVINMSLGMPAPSGLHSMSQDAQMQFIQNTYLDDEELWNQIFAVADQNNVTVVLAGGNDDVLVGIDPMQRSSNTIKVSAINPYIQKANFSNYGPYSTISAPGVEIYSALPNGNFGFLQGTSMASPMVTGGVALMKSMNPNLTNQEIIQILQQTGVPVSYTDKYVGNLMQLSAALGYIGGDSVSCPDIQRQIDSLTAEIERLRLQCQGNTDTNDAMIIPDDPDNYDFATGKWKSSSDLFNSNTKEAVELYFEFKSNGTGQVIFVEEDGNKCYSDLTLSLDNNSFSFAQTGQALCDNSERYLAHTYVCEQDDANNNQAKCVARSSDGDDLIQFTLVKIK